MAQNSNSDLITCSDPENVTSTATASAAGTSITPHGESALLNLPLDVLALIFETCDWPTAVTLRRTCRHFRYTFPVGETIRKATLYRQILASSDNGSYPAPCYGCLRRLPKDRFPRFWSGIEGEALGRRCTGCALASELLPRGAHYKWKQVDMLVCTRCGKHRSEKGRFCPDEPSDYCPHCRRIHEMWTWMGSRFVSAPFYAVTFCMAILILTGFTSNSIARLWPIISEHDHTIHHFALFTAAYQSFIQLFWLAAFTIARYLPTQNPVRRKAYSIVTSGIIAAETFAEFICLLVSCCLPFTIGHVASVKVIAWATITWCVASFGAIIRMIAEDDLKAP